MPINPEGRKVRFSSSLIKQGNHRFYTFTMPSDILAKCSFASRREEDPIKGFQRLLDAKRAKEIAEYIDSGLGTIPCSIVLSAQNIANFREVGGAKTVEFEIHPKSMLILDGQHRVFGFSMAETMVRVPVVVYNGLTRLEESRLFIDINTKQRPVPNELLLDIKSLADYESEDEQFLNQIFKHFNSNPKSPLVGLMSPSKRQTGKINRVSFYGAMRPIMKSFHGKQSIEVFETLTPYLEVFYAGLKKIKCADRITNPTVFKAIMAFFPEVGQRVKDRYKTYSKEAFTEVLAPFFTKVKANNIARSGYSYKDLYDHFSSCFRISYTI